MTSSHEHEWDGTGFCSRCGECKAAIGRVEYAEQLMDATWRCRSCDIEFHGQGVDGGEKFEPVDGDDQCPNCGQPGEFWSARAIGIAMVDDAADRDDWMRRLAERIDPLALHNGADPQEVIEAAVEFALRTRREAGAVTSSHESTVLHVYSCTRCPFWLTERWALCPICGGRMVEQDVQTDTPGFSLTNDRVVPDSGERQRRG